MEPSSGCSLLITPNNSSNSASILFLMKPCTSLVKDGDERSCRWHGTAKQGGECGIHNIK